MPSPIGHMIAGAAIGRAITPHERTVIVACAVLAVAPDLDLILPQAHRTWTHSFVAVAIVTIVAIAVTGKVKHSAALALAFASHLLLDWLAVDPTPPHGIQLLWPFSNDWYISGLDIFRGTARRNLFTARTTWINATAIAQEVAILGPVAWVTWRLRR